MRAEVKVYMSHTDAARIGTAAQWGGESLSGFLRRVALLEADRLNVPRYREGVLEGQMTWRELAIDTSIGTVDIVGE